MTDQIKILMHGPGISDPTRTDEREIPEIDVEAYKAIGWTFGAAPKAPKPVEAKVEAKADERPKAQPKGKAKK